MIDPALSPRVSSLFSLSIINQSNKNYNLKLEAELRSRSGESLWKQELSINLNSFQSLSIRNGGFNPNTTYINPSIERHFELNGKQLPPSDYLLCIKSVFLNETLQPIEECVEYSLSDFSNLSSIYPVDNSTIGMERPIFSWMDAQNPNAEYRITLVKIDGKQSKYQAIRRNTPYMKISNINSNSMEYPSDAPSLEEGERYAWQVSMMVGKGDEVRSEIWEFKYDENSPDSLIPNRTSYIDLNRVDNGSDLYAIGNFKFKIETNQSERLKVKLYSLDGSKLYDLNESRFDLSIGTNSFELDLYDQVYLRHKKKYKIVFESSKSGVSKSLVLTYINPDFID
ncbi:MAG: hypothetical protein CMP59_08710 [Flavobacteriales bacterium]|nr:hypothetical protein [Flavobacteriales bacterium]|tara:strand:+ start:796 stop:1815 length:1020 start_codon:yes stop_codon:yes gene_type:complete